MTLYIEQFCLQCIFVLITTFVISNFHCKKDIYRYERYASETYRYASVREDITQNGAALITYFEWFFGDIFECQIEINK